jgi:hypothetical protein
MADRNGPQCGNPLDRIRTCCPGRLLNEDGSFSIMLGSVPNSSQCGTRLSSRESLATPDIIETPGPERGLGNLG